MAQAPLQNLIRHLGHEISDTGTRIFTAENVIEINIGYGRFILRDKAVLKTFRVLYSILLLLSLSACESLSFYSQAAQGQWSLWWQRESVKNLLADPSTDPALKQKLEQVVQIRRFASEQLALPDNNSYRYYADIKRPYVVWNVFAAEEFSVTPRQWCFPVAGCVSYRGYFSEQAARDYAKLLAAQGYDTYVGGVAAYSTLGIFADPLLNTFIERDELRLAGLIFHELAHQQVYLPGDTTFNESFASAVEMAGVKRWLQSAVAVGSDIGGDIKREVSAELLLKRYQQRQLIHQDFIATMLAGRQRLQQLYQADFPAEKKRKHKQQIIDELIQRDYVVFKQRWVGQANYDFWLQPAIGQVPVINNAKLSTLASYHQWVPAFLQLLEQQGGDMAAFYQQVKILAQMKATPREQILAALSVVAQSSQANKFKD